MTQSTSGTMGKLELMVARVSQSTQSTRSFLCHPPRGEKSGDSGSGILSLLSLLILIGLIGLIGKPLFLNTFAYPIKGPMSGLIGQPPARVAEAGLQECNREGVLRARVRVPYQCGKLPAPGLSPCGACLHRKQASKPRRFYVLGPPLARGHIAAHTWPGSAGRASNVLPEL